MPKKLLKKFWPALIITIVICAFYIRLFFPEPSIYVTPDFARSDMLHSNLPSKLLLSQSLKSFQLPIWSNQIGQGFPVLAEGIAGTFYIPNLILFGLFPIEWAIPLMYLSTFLIAATGMYILLRKLKFLQSISTFGALSYTFCASMILHIQHFNFIQAASLLPIIFYVSLDFLERLSIKKSLLLLLLLSQLFFTGFVQIYIYTLIVLFSLIFLHYYLIYKKNLIKKIIIFVTIALASLIISAAQILPTLELNSKSARSEGLGAAYILRNFPMSPKNLVTYLNPFFLGSAKNGTANSTDWTGKGVYWESTSYIGILPLFFALFSIIFVFRSEKRNIYLVIALLALITALLSLGKYAPTHIFYSFPPLSLFRVPSRFILFTQFFLIILAAYGTKKVIDILPQRFKNLAGLIFISLLVGDIFLNWYYYNPIGSFNSWTSPPETAKIIREIEPQARVLSLGSGENWNDVFVPSGWDNKIDKYYFFRNSLDHNLNLLFGINQFNVFETLPTRRYLLLNAILNSNINIEENQFSINQKAKDILDNYNVKFIVSTKDINNDEYHKIFETEKDGYIYKIFESYNNAGYGKMYFDYKKVTQFEEFQDLFNNSDLQNTAILETDSNYKKLEASSSRVRLKDMKGGFAEFDVETETPGLFVVPITYYPGWKASIDKQKVEIMAANINSQAIEVPAGRHSVKFSYKPLPVKVGLIISLFTYASISVIIFFPLNKIRKFKYKLKSLKINVASRL